ncbi:MAG: hypothetical protein V1861_03030 [Candidatus Micrarchaeota archaeon]
MAKKNKEGKFLAICSVILISVFLTLVYAAMHLETYATASMAWWLGTFVIFLAFVCVFGAILTSPPKRK